MDEVEVERFFGRYEAAFREALAGTIDMGVVAALYADEFIAATPGGVMAAKNDAPFRQAMAQGYARYRAIGTKAMRLRGVRVAPIDDLHGLAHVGWRATYAREGGPDVEIDFEVHYLLQQKPGEDPKVFGWVSGDEEALLKAHGVL